MTNIHPIYRTRNKRFGDLGQFGRKRDPVLIQQTGISHQYFFPINKRFQAVTCQLEDLHVPPDGNLAGVGVLPDCLGYRVITPTFDRSNYPNHLFFGKPIPHPNLLHLEYTFRQRPGFVKNDRVNLRDRIQIISSFKKDALTGCRSDSPEIPQWNTNHQRTRARYYQKHESPIQPIIQHEREVRLHPRHDPRNQHDQHRQSRDYRRINPGKFPDKEFRRSLTLGSILHHFQNTSQGTLIIGLGHLYPHDPVSHDHPSQHGLSRSDVSRYALSSQSRRVKSRHVSQHRPVQRNPFPNFNFDNLSNTYSFGFLDYIMPIPYNRCPFRTHI